jgi:hypothetical protein
MSYHYGNPHLDELIAGVIPPVSGFVMPPGGGYGLGPPNPPWDGMITNPGGGGPAPIMPRFFPPVAAGMAGILSALYSPPVGEGSDFGYSERILDEAQKKGLKGRKLYPKPERNLGPRPSTKKDYGSKQKPTRPKSAWQKSQERRSKKRAEEEEERERQRQQTMQALQSHYARPNTIPAPLWEAYVPDEGMSNFSIWDDRGRYEGLDVEGLIDAIGVRTKVDPSTGIEY